MELLKNFVRKDLCHCIVCEGIFHREISEIMCGKICICKDCYKKIDRYKTPSAFDGKGNLQFLISAYPYSGVLKDAFAKYKFGDRKIYGEIFAFLITEAAKTFAKSGDFDLVIPVPLSQQRITERGFNQSAIMAEKLAECFGFSYSENALFRVKHTKRQSGLSSAQRNENVRGAFLADSDLVKNKRILIADDIYTRGATMGECARIVFEAGAKTVAGITLFKTHIPDYDSY